MASARLAFEALVVGLLVAAALGAISWAWPAALRGPARAALVGMAVGVAFHLGFELFGLNAAYCRTGHACTAARAN